MASVEVFVDDAVRGHLPNICAKTGAPADGRLRVVESSGGLRFGLLVLLGPLGWLALFVLLCVGSGRRTLTVRLPYSEAAVDRELRLVRMRLSSGVAAIGFVIFAVVVHSVPPLFLFSASLAAVAALIAAVAHVRLAWERVGISLDASHRWVTLSGVHPAFARAVREREAMSSVSQ
jgi:hypothetical protein